MQPLIEFEKQLTDMLKLHKSYRKEVTADARSLKQYLHIAFVSRAELDRRKQTVEALVDDYNKQQAFTECAKAFPKKAGLFKDAHRQECEAVVSGRFLIKAQHGIIDTKTAATKDFQDGSLSDDASRDDLVQKFKSLKADDHALVATALRVWQNMLEGKTIEARRLAMHRDPVSVLIALLDPVKFEETISHMSRVQIIAILKAMNNLMSGHDSRSYIFSNRAVLMRDIKNIIKTCRDMMGMMSKQEVRQALKILSPAPDMRRLIESLVRDEARAFLPWKPIAAMQSGGNRLTDIFKEVALLCLSVLCVVPIVPMLVIWMPYLMVPEYKKYQKVDPFADHIQDTFKGLTRNVNDTGFISKLLKGAENWIMFQYQLLATFSAARLLKRTAAMTTHNLQTYIDSKVIPETREAIQSLIPTIAKEGENMMRNLADVNKLTSGNKEFARQLAAGIDERVDKARGAMVEGGQYLGTWAIGKVMGDQVANGTVPIGTLLNDNVTKRLQDIESIAKRYNEDLEERAERAAKKITENAAEEINYIAARQLPRWMRNKDQRRLDKEILSARHGHDDEASSSDDASESSQWRWNPFARRS